MTELTEKEKEMLTTGIVFSTSKPNPLFIKDGMEGGNYVCEAYQVNDNLILVIYDLSLSSTSQRIHIDGKEIKEIKIHSWINSKGERDYRRCACILQISEGKGIVSEERKWTKDFTIWSFKYEGLSLDTQAKRYFIDFLRIYLEEKVENEKNSMEEPNTGTSEENEVSPI